MFALSLLSIFDRINKCKNDVFVLKIDRDIKFDNYIKSKNNYKIMKHSFLKNVMDRDELIWKEAEKSYKLKCKELNSLIKESEKPSKFLSLKYK